MITDMISSSFLVQHPNFINMFHQFNPRRKASMVVSERLKVKSTHVLGVFYSSPIEKENKTGNGPI
jgi:hypothetical protein